MKEGVFECRRRGEEVCVVRVRGLIPAIVGYKAVSLVTPGTEICKFYLILTLRQTIHRHCSCVCVCVISCITLPFLSSFDDIAREYTNFVV